MILEAGYLSNLRFGWLYSKVGCSFGFN